MTYDVTLKPIDMLNEPILIQISELQKQLIVAAVNVSINTEGAQQTFQDIQNQIVNLQKQLK